MAYSIPPTMKGLVTLKWAQPKDYTIVNDLAVPTISNPDEILIRVAAAAINPVDVKLASGLAKMMQAFESPYKIGLDVSGIIVAIGSSVTTLKVGDAVMSMAPMGLRGTFAEYAISVEKNTVVKPTNLSFVDAASLPLVGLTSLESLQWADKTLAGGLRGKTVLIPAGLSGTGNIAIQLALYHFNVGKVITTVSTQKLEKAKAFFGQEAEAGTGGQQRGEVIYVDYKTEDILQKIPHKSVDFLYECQPVVGQYMKLLKKGGAVVSISGLPSGKDFATQMPGAPLLIKWGLDAMDSYTRYKFSSKGLSYKYISMVPTKEMIETLKKDIERGWIRPLVGRQCKLDNVEEVKNGCQEVFDGKGGVGKFVAEVWKPEASAGAE